MKDKKYLFFNEIDENISIIGKNQLVALKPLIAGGGPSENDDVIIPIPDEISEIINKISGFGLTQSFNCVEEASLYVSRLEKTNINNLVSSYIYVICEFILGYDIMKKEHFNKIINEYSINYSKSFNKYLTNLQRIFGEPKKLDSPYKVHIYFSYKKHDAVMKNAIERILEIIDINNEITLNKHYCECFSQSSFMDLLKSNINHLNIIIGHGNNNDGIKINTHPSFNYDINAINEMYSGNLTDTHSLLLFNCGGEYFSKNKDKIIPKLNIGHSEGGISFEHTEIFLFAFLKLLERRLNVSDAFTVGKFVVSLRSSDFYQINYYNTK